MSLEEDQIAFEQVSFYLLIPCEIPTTEICQDWGFVWEVKLVMKTHPIEKF